MKNLGCETIDAIKSIFQARGVRQATHSHETSPIRYADVDATSR
ncbi:MAG: hypothetical protein AAF387_00245 [Pseudomonadota bacterium]